MGTIPDFDRADAVFEGGGIKGIAFAGALEVFEEAGIQWQNLAGASAGAITAGLVAIGYTASELKEVMFHRVDFRSFMDSTGLPNWLSLLFHRGMYKGDYFLNTMRDLIEEKTGKERLTFDDPLLTLPKYETDSQEDYEARYQYKLQMIASDISENRMLVLPQHLAHLGLNPGELEVAAAMRMSGSFPFFFKPVVLPEGRDSHITHWIIDGGMLSNFPIWLFDAPPGTSPAWPTIGFLLEEPEPQPKRHKQIRGLFTMIPAMIKTLIAAHDRKVIDELGDLQVVRIPTGKYNTLDFDLDQRDKEALYERGRVAAAKFLESFSFEAFRVRRKQLNKVLSSRFEQLVDVAAAPSEGPNKK